MQPPNPKPHFEIQPLDKGRDIEMSMVQWLKIFRTTAASRGMPRDAFIYWDESS